MRPSRWPRAAAWWSWAGSCSGPGRPTTAAPGRWWRSWPRSWGRACAGRRHGGARERDGEPIVQLGRRRVDMQGGELGCGPGGPSFPLSQLPLAVTALQRTSQRRSASPAQTRPGRRGARASNSDRASIALHMERGRRERPLDRDRAAGVPAPSSPCW